jgi:lysophospholipase L1-like esterase
LKQLHSIICGWPGWKWFCGTGWLLAALLGVWAAPRVYERLISQLPGAQRENWNRTLAEKKREVSARWLDQRPLVVLAGDSQIAFGNWHELFAGAWAVRNCGLAGAKIADVADLVSAIGEPHPKIVLLMCGVNNLGQRDNLETCRRDYEALLAAVRARLQPESILVLSVMPVRASAVDGAGRKFNVTVRQFNAALEICCRQHQVNFLDVNPAVADANGGLASELTVDGLHLNAEGYRRLAGIITPQLASLAHAP